VYEVLQMSNLRGYYTEEEPFISWSIYQIGFTTDFDDARSADLIVHRLQQWCTAPVLNVNGDDAEQPKCAEIGIALQAGI